MKPLILAATLLAAPAYAQTDAIAADAASTAAGLAAGAAEANPIGWATIPLRLFALEYAKTLPKEEGVQIEHVISAGGWGAAANNVCIVGAILTGGALAPLCPMVGMATGLHLWTQGQGEREFWAICAQERIYWGNPDMTCTYTAPEMAGVSAVAIGRQEVAP